MQDKEQMKENSGEAGSGSRRSRPTTVDFQEVAETIAQDSIPGNAVTQAVEHNADEQSEA
jgi:hypothetical protein